MAKETDEDRARKEILSAIHEVVETAAGRRFVHWLLGECRLYGSAFAGDSVATTNFFLGQQDIGRRVLLAMDQIDPRLYPEMLLKVADDRAIDRAVQDKASETSGENDDEIWAD